MKTLRNIIYGSDGRPKLALSDKQKKNRAKNKMRNTSRKQNRGK
jgi:hypothetical protein